ncbi:MAG: carbohydrate-binding family 9-like protein [Verrucomicrobiota bacterium]
MESGFWEKIRPVDLKETVTAQAPLQATWFKTAWNEVELRVLFHADDTHAWATLTEHDAPLYNEEVVEVFLDPAGDLECYFEIEVNPLNAVCDLVLRRTRSGYLKDFGWHCDGLRISMNKTPEFWSVEMAIPFASLGVGTPAIGEIWRANFYRIDMPENAPRELSAWSPTGRPLFHIQDKFGFLEFVR